MTLKRKGIVRMNNNATNATSLPHAQIQTAPWQKNSRVFKKIKRAVIRPQEMSIVDKAEKNHFTY